ncbi:hypothetical protein AC1031_004101 [Aphanomyces cochlioides]|nr:hypothetical protein AC1031_004101 [Aphanomyces cochlioides]
MQCVNPWPHDLVLEMPPPQPPSWSPAYDDIFYSSCDESDNYGMVLPRATCEADKCGYRTGKCFNMRTIKRNGTYHKLCEVHREKANLNQKKLDRKKRLQRDAPYDVVKTERHILSSPTTLDQAPVKFGFDEVEFFCDVMAVEPENLYQCQLKKDEVLHFMQGLLKE